MAKSHLHILSVNRFVDGDALMRHFGHGIGHLEYGRVHETQPDTRDEDREEIEQDPEYQDGDSEEGDHDELMDVDGNRDEEEELEGTTVTDELESSDDSGDDSDSENSDESGYASF
jgi:hypothetical protein